MTVLKGRVAITSEQTNENIKDVVEYDIKVFEKTDGNYKEVIAKIINKITSTFDSTNNFLIDTSDYQDECFKVYPNMSLNDFYDSLNALNYTVSYTEELTTI